MKSLLLLLSLTAGVAFAGTKPTVELSRSVYQNQNVLALKVDKELLGATFEILDSDGNIITHEELAKKKRTIDFTDLQNDEYIVRITKDDFSRTFRVFNDIEAGVLYENYR